MDEKHNISIGEKNLLGNNNICIGKNAGIELTSESNQLRLKSKSVDVSATLTEREYWLVKNAIDCLLENQA